MQNHKISLPIDDYLEEISLSLSKTNRILLKASPGSGKTTRLPWYLAQHQQGKVLVLEPRRIAAKLAAVRIAQENNLSIGKEIGYKFRFENEVSDNTKLFFYTEGTFLKAFKEINFSEFDTIILDEFHERHIETDLALALLMEKQKIFPQLKLILMSATLDLELQKYFPEAKVFEIEAKRFHVEIKYLANIPSVLNESLERKIFNSLKEVDFSEDVLIFLPGMREMRLVQDYLHSHFGEVYILHGDLTKEEQKIVFEPSHKRKIILSTNIAESSVTIPGIRVVIDAGIQRESIFENWTGLKQLQDKPTTQDSAIQRAGRAGRETDGKCFRLYSKLDFDNRARFADPAILKEDLLDTYLQVLDFNLTHPLPTPPPENSWLKARDLAHSLGLVRDEKLTSTGKKALNYPTQIRIGNIFERCKDLSERALNDLLQFIASNFENENPERWKMRIKKQIPKTGSEEVWQKYLLYGFIDQVSKYRSTQNDFVHFSGRTIKPTPYIKDLTPGLYLILNVTRREEASLVVPIEEEWLYDFEPFPFKEDLKVQLQDSTISFRQTTSIGRIVLEENLVQKSWAELNLEDKNKILISSQKKFDDELERFKSSKIFRKFALSLCEQEPDFSLEEYFEDVQKLQLKDLESYFISKVAHLHLDQVYPDKIKLKNKKEFVVHYDDSQIYLEAFIQDFYGLEETPMLNQKPLTLKILGPHKRSLQVTKDLMSFWNNGYKELLKELKREYPRHHWADTPTKALPVLLKRQLP